MAHVNSSVNKLWFSLGYIYTKESVNNCFYDGYVHQSTMVNRMVISVGYVISTANKYLFSLGYIYTKESVYNCFNDGLRTSSYTG